MTEAIASPGISRALREKLADLESRCDNLERSIGLAVAGPEAVELLPRTVDRWRELIDDLENLGRHPGADANTIAETREHLAGLLGRVKLTPENGELVAEMGLQGPGSDGLHIRMVAGAHYANFRRRVRVA